MLLVVGGMLIVDKAVQTSAEAQAVYKEARQTCPSEIWLVYEDIGAVLPQDPAVEPYPERVEEITGGSHLHGYGCTREEALDLERNLGK